MPLFSAAKGWRRGAPDDRGHGLSQGTVHSKHLKPPNLGTGTQNDPFPFDSGAHTSSAHRADKEGIRSTFALTSLPCGHRARDKQKPGLEARREWTSRGAAGCLAPNAACLPSLPIKPQHGNNEWSLQISH